MPLLQMILKRSCDSAGVYTNHPIVLTGGVVKQPLVLKYFAVQTYNDLLIPVPLKDTIISSSAYVDLPFLNNYDVNSNAPSTNSIFIPIDYDTSSTKTICYGNIDILFNPAKNIDSNISTWHLFDDAGEDLGQSDSTIVTVTLMFEYRRPDLI